MGTGNAAYRYALQELTELRAAVATYHRQSTEMSAQLKAARCVFENVVYDVKLIILPIRDAYTQIYYQQKERVCEERHIETAPRDPKDVEVPEANACTTAPSPVQGQEPDTRPSEVHQVSVPPQTTATPLEDVYGPVLQQGGFHIVNHTGPWSTASTDRPSDLPVQVFWKKSDWFGKGYSNGSFVTDRNGKPLKYLVKGIRSTARKIWNELYRRPGGYVATTFKRNSHAFKSDFVATIEEIYPCLKLCCGHWKALQIGVAAYSYWYKRHGRRDIPQYGTMMPA